MPHPPIEHPDPSAVSSELLRQLRSRENPFDVYVEGQKISSSFGQQHVPEVNLGCLTTIKSALTRYRAAGDPVAGRTAEPEPPRSGAVVILGARGAGKTHLLHALKMENVAAILVTPAHFDPQRPFAEFLLQQLVRTLQDEPDSAPRAALAGLAEWFARRVLEQSLYGMTEPEWLAHRAPRSPLGLLWKVLHWNGGDIGDRELLRLDLRNPSKPLSSILSARGQDPATIRRIGIRHVQVTEPERTVGEQIRRRLYLELIEYAFSRNPDSIFEFLLDRYTDVQSAMPPSRAELVAELLNALVELFLLFGRPVVFAFDALEVLLHDPPNRERCQAFTQGLADIIENYRGIPLLVFAERGHWQGVYGATSQFARHRLEQGIPTTNEGAVDRIDLPPVTKAELEKVIERRMRPFLNGESLAAGTHDQPVISPFTVADVADAMREAAGDALRIMLRNLKIRYDTIVYGKDAADSKAPDVQPLSGTDGKSDSELPGTTEEATQAENERLKLEADWRAAMKAAGRKIKNNSLFSLADAFHEGIQQWLECVIAANGSVNGWSLNGVERQIVGNHPTYGHLLKCEWRDGARRFDMAVGFLLAGGKGMPRDLSEKLQAVALPQSLAEKLLILWPRGAGGDEEGWKLLPPASRKEWDAAITAELQDRVRLRIVALPTLAPWLAVEALSEASGGQKGAPLTIDASRHISQLTMGLLREVSPW